MESLDAESDSETVTDTTGDLSDLSASHYQGVMLLQKLQQLKVWQAAQEELLVKEQQREINMRLGDLDLTEDMASVTGAQAEELDETTEADAACESLAMDSVKSTPILEDRPVAGGSRGSCRHRLRPERGGRRMPSGTVPDWWMPARRCSCTWAKSGGDAVRT